MIEKPHVSFEFLDENSKLILFDNKKALAENMYMYKIFEREHSDDIEIIVNEIDELSNLLTVNKIELIHTYYQAYMSMAFHYHHFQFNDQGGNVGMKGLKKMGSQKINDIANDTFIFHSLRIFFFDRTFGAYCIST